MMLYDYELLSRAIKDIKQNPNPEMKPKKINYEFVDYSDPYLIKNVRAFQKEEDLNLNIAKLKTPINVTSAQLKLPQVKITYDHPSATSLPNTFAFDNTLNIEKTPSNFQGASPSPHIPLLESHLTIKKTIEMEEIENEVKKRLDMALDVEREAQKLALEKMMEEKFNDWEQDHKNREIQDNIKNKDAVLNEMYEKINIEEQKFQMLMKIRELDDENSGLKMFMETCPPYYNYHGNDEEFDDQLSEDEGDNEEIVKKIKEKEMNEIEEKKKREIEFFELCEKSQEILNSMATEDNTYEREMKINPELW